MEEYRIVTPGTGDRYPSATPEFEEEIFARMAER